MRFNIITDIMYVVHLYNNKLMWVRDAAAGQRESE